MNAPLEECPGTARQGESPEEHKFTLLTCDHFYGNSPEILDPLREMGFDFSPSTNPHIVLKTRNPPDKITVDTIMQLRQFIAKRGPVFVTADGELVMAGSIRLPYTEPAVPGNFPGYTSVGYDKK